MTPEELEPTEGISRRKMIKRIGAGAAIAWSAPILTSVRAPAFAANYGCPPCPTDNCNPQFQPCDGGGCQTGDCEGGQGCFSSFTQAGCCMCFQNIFCSCIGQPSNPICTKDSDCNPGQGCILGGCGFSGACADCCGQNCHNSSGSGTPSGAKLAG